MRVWLLADGPTLALRSLAPPSGTSAFTFRERKNLGAVQHRFESRINLVNWGQVTRSSLVTVSNLPDVYLLGAMFSAPDVAGYFRLRFSMRPGPSTTT